MSGHTVGALVLVVGGSDGGRDSPSSTVGSERLR